MEKVEGYVVERGEKSFLRILVEEVERRGPEHWGTKRYFGLVGR